MRKAFASISRMGKINGNLKPKNSGGPTVKNSVLTLVLCAVAAHAAPSSPSTPDVFYVYDDKGSPKNHFIPSGWMGDYGDLKISDADATNPKSGKTAIKWTYSGEAKQGANWAGAFWQNPANNWGEKMGGYDLSAYKRLTFWARGAKGNERIAEFKIGGISGEHGDSDAASIGPIELTKDWKQYTIDLADKNLAHIIGGFCWSASRDDNPDGFVIFLDDIRFEK